MSIKEERKRASRKTLKRKNAQLDVVPASAIRDPRVRIVIDFMNANLHRNISLTELTGAADLSTSHLSLLFNIETGLSPGEYLRRLRMEKVRHLLATSLLRIKQIMAMTGYNDRRNFVRLFRRYFDLSPSEYRKCAPQWSSGKES